MEKHYEKRWTTELCSSLRIETLHSLINRVAKVEDLQHDVQVTRETFERIVDRKDDILHSLSQDIEEAEEQYHSHK